MKEKDTLHRHQENVYRSVVEPASDSLYMVDRECRYLFVNNPHLSRLGLTIEQIIGKRYRDFHTPGNDREFTGAAKNVFSPEESVQQEHRSERDQVFSPDIDPLQ